MSEPADLTAPHKRRIQALYATGYLSIEEYNELGRLHGFVSPIKAPSSARLRQAATIVGYVMLVLGAAAQAISARHPEMKGPLDAVVEISRIVGEAL